MSSKHFGYYDNWKTEILTCPKCGWTGTFEQGDVEYYSELTDCSCPQCPWGDGPILAIISYPTMAETEANFDRLSDKAKASFLERKRFLSEVERSSLKSPDQLPDLTAFKITISWDFKEEQDGTLWTFIKFADQILWSERAVYDGAERFVEVVGILAEKYGERLLDVAPSKTSETYLYGDYSGSVEMVKAARSRLQRKHNHEQR